MMFGLLGRFFSRMRIMERATELILCGSVVDRVGSVEASDVRSKESDWLPPTIYPSSYRAIEMPRPVIPWRGIFIAGPLGPGG